MVVYFVDILIYSKTLQEHVIHIKSILLVLRDQHLLCVLQRSLRELLTLESHSGGLMGHFSVLKTYAVLIEHFYWPNMKRDVERICASCVQCKMVKSTSHPHGLYTPLPVPFAP